MRHRESWLFKKLRDYSIMLSMCVLATVLKVTQYSPAAVAGCMPLKRTEKELTVQRVCVQ